MRRPWLIVLILAFALLPTFASAHPPAADPDNACVGLRATAGTPSATSTVPAVLSYVAPSGTSIPLCRAFGPIEWGGHASCGSVLVVGPVAGAYCGPLVLAGATATCTWTWAGGVHKAVTPDFLGLVIGFDTPLYNGMISMTLEREGPVTTPLAPGAWTVTNPYNEPARVLAFPTNTAMPGAGPYAVLDPTATDFVTCVTP